MNAPCQWGDYAALLLRGARKLMSKRSRTSLVSSCVVTNLELASRQALNASFNSSSVNRVDSPMARKRGKALNPVPSFFRGRWAVTDEGRPSSECVKAE